MLTETTGRMFIDRYSVKSGLTACPTTSPRTPRLRRFTGSRLYAQVLNVLREDDIDDNHVPDDVSASLFRYIGLLREKAYLDYT